jgi:hypothetical protein
MFKKSKMAMAMLLLVSFSTLSHADDTVMGNQPTVHRGAPFVSKETISLDEVAKNIEKYNQKTVLIKAKITNVCKAKGCWMVVASEQNSARITFKDYAFFVPFDIKEKDALVEGVVEIKQLSEADRNHLAKDAKTSVDQIPKVEMRIVASGVEISQIVKPNQPEPKATEKSGHDCGEH